MTVTEEMLIAYLDGELDAEHAAAVETALAADPALSERAVRHRALADRVRGAFAPVAAEPVPERLSAMLGRNDTKVVDLAARRARRVTWQAWGALAASVAAGLVVGLAIPRGSPVLGDQMAARGELAQALEERASGRGQAMEIGLTFKDHAGRYCRTFAGDGVSGLACREKEAWKVELAVRQPKASETEYRTAASVTAAPVLNMVDQLIAGEPLDAEQEAAARASNWSK